MATPNKCFCGEIPELVKVGDWPAQYRIICKCGARTLGFYYGSDDEAYRYNAAKKSAITLWNLGERE